MTEAELLYFFFFQAEDGIRDDLVTGVQTCALPISAVNLFRAELAEESRRLHLRRSSAGRREQEKKDEKELEYLVGSGNRRWIAGMRERSRGGTRFAEWPGKPEQASGPAERQTGDAGSYTSDVGHARAGECGRRYGVQGLSGRESE